MSLRFEYPWMLWGLLGVAFLALLVVIQAKRKGDFSYVRIGVALLGFGACVFGLARPQGGHYATSQRGMRGDLYIAIDISNSMRVEDISPSRLEFSTAFVRRVLAGLPGLRAAIFPFAATGYLQVPLSMDREATADLISTLTPSITTNQGTQFDSALTSLYTTIHKRKTEVTQDSAPTRVLLLSDGESHEKITGSVLSKFRSAGIPIDTVGVGTQVGGPIPIESKTGFGKDLLRDEKGTVVRSRVDAANLRKIAEETGGIYYGPQFEEADRAASRILQGMEFGKLTTSFKIEKEFYPLCFLLALCVFSAWFCFGRWHYWIRSLCFLLLPQIASAIDPMIESRLGSDPVRRPYHAYNAGVERAKKGDPSQAAELFAEAAGATKDPALRKRALYDLGNALVKLEDPTQALVAYQRAYDTNAESDKLEKTLNHDISHNMLLAKKLKQQQQKQEQERDQQGEGEQDPNQPPPDPGKAKQFTGQTFDERQKKRMYDLVSSEEQQVMQRLQQGKNQKNAPDAGGKPW